MTHSPEKHNWLPRITGVFLWLILFNSSFAQQVDMRKGVKITLSDETQVSLYPSVDYRNQFYYSPVNLRISIKNAQPEYSFLTFKENDEGPVTGGLFHILLTWGLDSRQEAEALQKLQATVDSTAQIYGALPVEPVKTISGFEIISGNKGAEILRRSLKSAAGPPTVPGGKMAASFMFSAADAIEMEKMMADPAQFEETTFRFTWNLGQTEQIITLGTLLRHLF
ncbi:MAG: hypothetical protein SF052_21685 [Bacteroidia bacterium]|nr:hypothetical protein [Bacteroidia bacterium]